VALSNPGWVRRLRTLMASSSERANALHEWRRWRGVEPDLPAGSVRRVLVICLGNICRSPFAERLLASRHPELSVRSAGFIAEAGSPADPIALRVAARFRVDLASHATRRLVAEDLDWADLILAMEGDHVARLARLRPTVQPKARLLGDFLPSPPFTIRDPWGQSETVFDLTFQRIEAAVKRVSARLEARSRG
jgi:low molecular weight protein-tyrosine phosphatase